MARVESCPWRFFYCVELGAVGRGWVWEGGVVVNPLASMFVLKHLYVSIINEASEEVG